MSATAYWSWLSAERKCFDFVNKALGTVEGIQGYKPEDFPRVATLSSECNNWMFEISGGDSPFIRSPSEQGNTRALWMQATFKGRFTERDLAQRVACAVWDVLPSGESTDPTLAGIAQIQPTAYPSVVSDVVELTSDLAVGGEARVWIVTIPCWVVFGYLEQV